MQKLIQQNYITPSLGCDPELFVARDGKVIGSEKVMPEGGVIFRHGVTYLNANEFGENKVVMDGVQVELHPMSATCREALCTNIGKCFQYLDERLKQVKADIDFSQLIEVSQDEFDSLSGDSKRLGCMPSFNVYKGEGGKLKVKGETYRKRSAGGHIHLGDDGSRTINKVLKDAKKLIPLMDAIVGNTSVLIDRDPANAIRREVYGRAGEHRLPKYGIEYRTPSNYWLRDYVLMSMVMGLSRFAVNILHSGKKNYDEFMSVVDTDDIRKAINENDFELAWKNFTKIEPMIMALVDETQSNSPYPLHKHNIEAFKHFIKMGIDHWFPLEGTTERWIRNANNGRGYGWENFLSVTVATDLNKSKKENKNESK